jgi:hypothetical protein
MNTAHRTGDTADTVELPTFTRAVGGTDPHPATVEDLIGGIDDQVDAIWSASASQGTVEDADAFWSATRELVTLAQSLEGRAGERAEMLRSTAAAAMDGDSHDYDAVMARVHGDEVPR